MARRKGTRWRTRVKKVYSRSKGGGGGFKPVIDGLIAGVGGQFASKFVGNYGIPAGALAVGLWRNNTVLKTEGARELGILLSRNLPFIGGGGGGNGGGFE